MPNTPSDWNPDLYLKFRSERTQPVLDLVNRIDIKNPRSIIDIGSGPGTSTEILAARWPEARITGIDSSEAMIREARAKYPGIEWRLADAASYHTSERFDIVFANAVIHWIPNHKELLPHLFGMTTEHGALAVQMPLTAEMKMAELIENAFRTVVRESDFDINSVIHYHPVPFYLNALGSLSNRFNAWTTTYYHLMDSARAVYDMMRSTRMRPYLDRLKSEEQRSAFEAALLDAIEATYDKLSSGKIVFPFKRLFLLLYRNQGL